MKTFIRKDDFHNSKEFLKINKHIDTCLTLIERLVDFNRKCSKEVDDLLKVESYIIDYRVDQFAHYHETLSGLYYSCYSLKHVYDISVMMNFKKVDTTIGLALNNQMRYIAFTGIVKMASTFEFTRKKYENEIKGKNYYNALKEKYPQLGNSLELLTNFRNTIHSNGIWEKSTPLEYKLQTGPVVVRKGEKILIENWLLYRLIYDCIKLGKLMALDNKPAFIRDTKLMSGGERVIVLQLDKESIDKLKNLDPEL